MITAKQAQIIEQARSWLGTPFAYQAQAKGVGADCVAVVLDIYRSHTEYNDADAYRDYGFKPNFAKTVSLLCKYSTSQLHKNDIQPGDIILYLVRGSPHFGVYTDCNTVIQCNLKVGKYVEVTHHDSDLIYAVFRL